LTALVSRFPALFSTLSTVAAVLVSHLLFHRSRLIVMYGKPSASLSIKQNVSAEASLEYPRVAFWALRPS
jgi:hypothetical protein